MEHDLSRLVYISCLSTHYHHRRRHHHHRAQAICDQRFSTPPSSIMTVSMDIVDIYVDELLFFFFVASCLFDYFTT